MPSVLALGLVCSLSSDKSGADDGTRTTQRCVPMRNVLVAVARLNVAFQCFIILSSRTHPDLLQAPL